MYQGLAPATEEALVDRAERAWNEMIRRGEGAGEFCQSTYDPRSRGCQQPSSPRHRLASRGIASSVAREISAGAADPSNIWQESGNSVPAICFRHTAAVLTTYNDFDPQPISMDPVIFIPVCCATRNEPRSRQFERICDPGVGQITFSTDSMVFFHLSVNWNT